MAHPEQSPIVIIKQKELELAERLALAKQAAEREILEARQWATDCRDRAEREGLEKANLYYRAELEACDAEAEKVREDGALAARWIAESGNRNLEQAVQAILELVLPALPTSKSLAQGGEPDQPKSALGMHGPAIAVREGGQ